MVISKISAKLMHGKNIYFFIFCQYSLTTIWLWMWLAVCMFRCYQNIQSCVNSGLATVTSSFVTKMIALLLWNRTNLSCSECVPAAAPGFTTSLTGCLPLLIWATDNFFEDKQFKKLSQLSGDCENLSIFQGRVRLSRVQGRKVALAKCSCISGIISVYFSSGREHCISLAGCCKTSFTPENVHFFTGNLETICSW